jgi:hypothetical protein
MEKWLKDSRGAQLHMRLLKESGMAKSECFKNIFMYSCMPSSFVTLNKFSAKTGDFHSFKAIKTASIKMPWFSASVLIHKYWERWGWAIGPLVAAIQRHHFTPSMWATAWTRCFLVLALMFVVAHSCGSYWQHLMVCVFWYQLTVVIQNVTYYK